MRNGELFAEQINSAPVRMSERQGSVSAKQLLQTAAVSRLTSNHRLKYQDASGTLG